MGLAVGYPPGFRLDEHTHDWDQLVHAVEGVLEVRTAAGVWIVPPERAVWVPSGVPHAVECVGRVAMRTLYFPSGSVPSLGRQCCVVRVSALLRELVLHAIVEAPLVPALAAHERLRGVIFDQLAELPELPLELRWPRDARATLVAKRLARDPASTASLSLLARGSGASLRTLERLFRAETGLPLGKWRCQVRLHAALRLLAAGRAVTEVAFDVGYESPSAFIAMFRRELGVTPGKYAAQ